MVMTHDNRVDLTFSYIETLFFLFYSDSTVSMKNEKIHRLPSLKNILLSIPFWILILIFKFLLWLRSKRLIYYEFDNWNAGNEKFTIEKIPKIPWNFTEMQWSSWISSDFDYTFRDFCSVTLLFFTNIKKESFMYLINRPLDFEISIMIDINQFFGGNCRLI